MQPSSLRVSGLARTAAYQLRIRPQALYGRTFSSQKPRLNSYTDVAATTSSRLRQRIRNFIYGLVLSGTAIFGYIYITDTRSALHQYFTVPTLRWIIADAEEAHHAGNKALRTLWSFGLYPRERGDPNQFGDLTTEVFGLPLDNPIGTSAGIDKQADIPDPLFAIGPAIVEIGGITPLPQPGNAKPRVWRLPSQKALINRYGLNSEGADYVAMRLRQRVREYANRQGLGIDEAAESLVLNGAMGVPPGSLQAGRLLAVQVSKNKTTPDSDIKAVRQDYVYCVERLARYADIIVVNVSSPNTPGLRDLQKSGPLKYILDGVVSAAKSTDRRTKPAVMVKVSPDEDSQEQVIGIVEAVMASGIDGVIVGNTTNRRPDPLPAGFSLPPEEQAALRQQGGYSGPQLFPRTVRLVARYRALLDSAVRDEMQRDYDSRKAAVSKKNKTQPAAVKVSATSDDKRERDASIQRDAANLKPLSSEPEKQSIIQIPTHETSTPKPRAAELSSSETQDDSSPKRKVIFATGGITNGAQAIEVLQAGADVAQVYTALVYGGVGTITRIKREMCDEIRTRSRQP